MSAIITYMLQSDWDPVSATEWGTRPGGQLGREAFIFDELTETDSTRPLLEEFERTVDLQQWRTAATHVCGAGLE